MSSRRERENRAKLAQSTRPSNDVAVVYCRPTMIDGAHHDCMLGLFHWDGRHDQRIAVRVACESGPRIARARNDVVAAALAHPDVQWVFMIDGDMTCPEDTLDRMLAVVEETGIKFLGGLCFAGGRAGLVHPTVYTMEHDDAGRLTSSLQLSYPKDALFRVHGTGAACILVHRQVFEDVLKTWRDKSVHPWFQETTVPPNPETGYPGDEFGEDITFCLRAGAAGHEVWIDSRVKFGHRKSWTMDEQSFVEFTAKLAAGGSEAEIIQAELVRMGLAA